MTTDNAGLKEEIIKVLKIRGICTGPLLWFYVDYELNTTTLQQALNEMLADGTICYKELAGYSLTRIQDLWDVHKKETHGY